MDQYKTSNDYFMIHLTPSTEIFNEITETTKRFWKNHYSDEHGYVTEKIDIINSIVNYKDNVMICYRMLDHNNQLKILEDLSEEAKEYISLNY